MRALLVTCTLALIPAISQEKESYANCKILFSPEGRVAEELITLIGKEDKSIKAAVYCLMHNGIAKALMDAHQRGVKVEVIVDPFSVKARSPVKKMETARLPVYVWNPAVQEKETRAGRKVRQKPPLMHDKFCVFGDKRVWTGSFNFTHEATSSNRENVVILENREIAQLYLDEFERLKKAGCVPLNEYSGGGRKAPAALPKSP